MVIVSHLFHPLKNYSNMSYKSVTLSSSYSDAGMYPFTIKTLTVSAYDLRGMILSLYTMCLTTLSRMLFCTNTHTPLSALSPAE